MRVWLGMAGFALGYVVARSRWPPSSWPAHPARPQPGARKNMDGLDKVYLGDMDGAIVNSSSRPR